MRGQSTNTDARHRRLPLLDVFRLAHAYGARQRSGEGGDVDPAGEATMDMSRLLSAGEMQQRLSDDLDRLLSSVHLEANYAHGHPLDRRRRRDLDLPERVAASIVNHGLPDIYGLTSSDTAMDTIAIWLETALRRHEPRIRSIKLTPRALESEDEGLVRFDIAALAGSDPYVISVDMTAEIDLGAGRVRTSKGPA